MSFYINGSLHKIFIKFNKNVYNFLSQKLIIVFIYAISFNIKLLISKNYLSNNNWKKNVSEDIVLLWIVPWKPFETSLLEDVR